MLLLNGDQDPYGYPDDLVDRNHGMTFAAESERDPMDSIDEMAGQIVAFCQL
ncbi:hypothetical protein [Vulcanococcus sp.]|uniref:hypothetical protein n=1 Tax=Vulcanococcus sp. TaxID=2856995 RepID=UPI003F6983BF